MDLNLTLRFASQPSRRTSVLNEIVLPVFSTEIDVLEGTSIKIKKK
jgi:hypothetical protein